MRGTVVSVLLFMCGSAAAAVTFTSATRTTGAQAGFGASDTDAFPGLGSWSNESYVEYTDAAHSPGRPSWGRAMQISSIGTVGDVGIIQAAGGQSGFDGYPVGGQGQGIGRNIIIADFTHDVATPARLMGLAQAGATFAGSWSIAVRPAIPGADPILLASFATTFGPFDQTELLPAGSYTFAAEFRDGWAGASTGQGSGSFDFTLMVPAPMSSALLLSLARRRRR